MHGIIDGLVEFPSIEDYIYRGKNVVEKWDKAYNEVTWLLFSRIRRICM